jgi:hypothetical protein
VAKNEIAKRPSSSLKDKGQYAVAFSLIGVMLYVAGFPVFFLLFVGFLTYFVWKIFSSESRSDARRIFEFYLSANEILRDDYRRWYGFEINETIARGEKIVRAIPSSPPLVHFALGALYDRLNDHSSAFKHLSCISEESTLEEGIVFPSNELREYVRILRRIERSPAEAPQTSAAVRSLERLRKNRTKSLIEKSRVIVETQAQDLKHHISGQLPSELGDVDEIGERSSAHGSVVDTEFPISVGENGRNHSSHMNGLAGSNSRDQLTPERKTISEVLHDIYDEKVQ